MEQERLAEAVNKLAEELRLIREVLDETKTELEWLARNEKDYLSAIADAVEELRGEYLARVRWEQRPNPHLCSAETIACANCDTDSPTSLAHAVREGWSRFQADDSTECDYLGICPDCAKKLDEIPARQRDLF
jgi:hypothetical protein